MKQYIVSYCVLYITIYFIVKQSKVPIHLNSIHVGYLWFGRK